MSEPEVYRDQEFQLYKVIDDFKKPRVENCIFERCKLYGPALVAMGSIRFEKSVEASCTLEQFLIESDAEHAPAGSIYFEDCVFKECKFSLVTFIGRPNQVAHLKEFWI